MSKLYYQPIVSHLSAAHRLAGGWLWFDDILVLSRDGTTRIRAQDAPPNVISRLTRPRPMLSGISLDQPRLMGILNVTPDSFSDGGKYDHPTAAIAHARHMARAGASIIDIGGESTRPGADYVEPEAEIARTAPVIRSLKAEIDLPISIDTRKSNVAQAALQAGADWVNDVSALIFDPAMKSVVATAGAPLCLMHAQGTPDIMQNNPAYDHVVMDVYDHLEQQITIATDAGIARSNIIVDPGIGFGKTLDHNLALLKHLSVFHGLGCPILLGTSRKRFIGTITGADSAETRAHGSVATAQFGISQGAQIIRAHDVPETMQMLSMYCAMVRAHSSLDD